MVGMACNGSIGADHHYVAVLAGLRRSIGSRFDHSNYSNLRGGANFVERKRGGRIAGDDQKFGALGLQMLNGAYGVMGNGDSGFRSIGKASGVTKIQIVGVGNRSQQGRENRKAADAGVEDADGRPARAWLLQISLVCDYRCSSFRRADL